MEPDNEIPERSAVVIELPHSVPKYSAGVKFATRRQSNSSSAAI